MSLKAYDQSVLTLSKPGPFFQGDSLFLERGIEDMAKPCPCGLGMYEDCCGIYHHKNQAAPTAEALMRSRYSAYALGLIDYVYQTHHPKHRGDKAGMQQWAEQVRFVQLEVLDTFQGQPQDKIGKVSFRAHYVLEGQRQVLKETSRFKRYKGQWVYVDGILT